MYQLNRTKSSAKRIQNYNQNCSYQEEMSNFPRSNQFNGSVYQTSSVSYLLKNVRHYPQQIVTTPAEIAYHEGLREITGREGGTCWQVKLLQACWQSCHLDISIIKGMVRTTWWDMVGKLDGVMVAHVVNCCSGISVVSIPAAVPGLELNFQVNSH